MKIAQSGSTAETLRVYREGNDSAAVRRTRGIEELIFSASSAAFLCELCGLKIFVLLALDKKPKVKIRQRNKAKDSKTNYCRSVKTPSTPCCFAIND